MLNVFIEHIFNKIGLGVYPNRFCSLILLGIAFIYVNLKQLSSDYNVILRYPLFVTESYKVFRLEQSQFVLVYPEDMKLLKKTTSYYFDIVFLPNL
jgi:hypothetical protein